MTVDDAVRRWLMAFPGLVWAPTMDGLNALITVPFKGAYEAHQVTAALWRAGYDPRQQNNGYAYALPEKPLRFTR